MRNPERRALVVLNGFLAYYIYIIYYIALTMRNPERRKDTVLYLLPNTGHHIMHETGYSYVERGLYRARLL